eukprot:7379695-Alexandrium_andersonii.AAC.1
MCIRDRPTAQGPGDGNGDDGRNSGQPFNACSLEEGLAVLSCRHWPHHPVLHDAPRVLHLRRVRHQGRRRAQAVRHPLRQRPGRHHCRPERRDP